MTIRPNITSLPQLTNPTEGETLFVVQDSTVNQYITVPQARSLLNTVGPTGPIDLLDRPVLLDLPDNKDLLAHKGLLVLQGGLVLQVSVVLQAHRESQDLQDGLGLEVQLVHKVSLDLRDGLALREPQGQLELRVIKVSLDPLGLILLPT